MQDTKAGMETKDWGTVLSAAAVEGVLKVVVGELNKSLWPKVEHCVKTSH